MACKVNNGLEQEQEVGERSVLDARTQGLLQRGGRAVLDGAEMGGPELAGHGFTWYSRPSS